MNINTNSKTKLLICIILLLSGLLRIYKLDKVPPSPYWEEVALGYDAYSIAKTGKDHHGNSFPVIAFPSYGDYKPSGYFYAIVPFVKVFGLNIWTVRLPSAIAGIISVLLVYLIGKELFEGKVGLVGSFLFAIQPWAIQFSRGGWEVNFAMMLILMGTWLLCAARRKPWILPLSVIFFSLSMYTYHAARLFAPLIGALGAMLLLYGWYRGQHAKKPKKVIGVVLISLLIAIASVAPFVLNLNNKAVSSRFTDTSIFSQLQPILDSNAAIAAHGNSFFAKIIYHRYWYFGAIIFRQWVSHFSPNFLFVRGDGNYRHWNGIVGELYWIDGFFILVSVSVLLLSFKKNRKMGLLFIWIALAALPAALVTPAPHALRFLFAAPTFALLSAIGMVYLFHKIKKQWLVALLMCVVGGIYIFSFGRYHNWYMNVYPVQAASDWQYGYKELYQWIGENKKENEQVYITREQGRPAMYYLFYTKYDPATLQGIEPSLPKDQLELLQVGDYHFIDALSDDQKGLIATSGTKVVAGGTIVKNIEDLERNIIWVIWRKE
ncbi:MAG: glycosyltransferase family 39 protein [Candidatus Woesebacteria bacterium]